MGIQYGRIFIGRIKMAVTTNTFWIETYTGRTFYIQEPSPDYVCLKDIAHSLSNLCRYNGHCEKFYSVAEHSVHVAKFIEFLKFPTTVVMAALLHDACEAYTGDFPSPIKWAIPELQTMEKKIQEAVHEHFNIGPQAYKNKVIDDIDKRIVQDERKALMTKSCLPWAVDGYVPLNITVEAWVPEVAEKKFLEAFDTLNWRNSEV